jgi:hypothetical protein
MEIRVSDLNQVQCSVLVYGSILKTDPRLTRILIIYRCAPVSTVNTFQDLPRLSEIADNTERYIQRDIRVTNINTIKFN